MLCSFAFAGVITALMTAIFIVESQLLIAGVLLGTIGAIVISSKFGVTSIILKSLGENENLSNALAVLVTLALIVIFYDDHYVLFILCTILLYSVTVLGLNIQLGYAGLINFSGAAFFGVGGYTAAVLSQYHSIPPILTLVIGGIIAAIVGSILLLPILRTSGHYSALVTLAFALLFKVFLDVNDSLGGAQGVDVGSFTLFGWDFGNDITIGSYDVSFYVPYVLASLVMLCVVFFFVRRIERSWIGLCLDSVRIDEVSSSCFGINIVRWKIVAFTIGNFVAGLSGALYASILGYISPANFSFGDSLMFLSILLLGGIGNLWGTIIAPAIVVVLPEKFQVIQEYRLFIYSTLVLLMIVYRPVGLLPRKTRTYRPGESS